jgi:hypothetical protein
MGKHMTIRAVIESSACKQAQPMRIRHILLNFYKPLAVLRHQTDPRPYATGTSSPQRVLGTVRDTFCPAQNETLVQSGAFG